MSGWLLDTNVLSELSRSAPHDNVVAFISQHPDKLWIGDVTIAEIEAGIRMQANDERRETIRTWQDEIVMPQFAGRILSISTGILIETFRIMRETRQQGITISTPDLLIAATASFHEFTVVSRDTCPYRQAGLPVLDPWGAIFYPPAGDGTPIDLSTGTFPEWRP